MNLTPTAGKFNTLMPLQTTVRGKTFEAVLLLIIVALFYWFIVSPKMSVSKETDLEYQALLSQQTELTNNKNKLDKAISDLKSHSQEVANMDEALPLDNRVTKLYIALDSLTRDSGMTVGNISISFNSARDMAGDKALLANPFSVTRTLQKLTTTITAIGSFSQFQSLLGKLENSGRLINISSMNISAGQAGAFAFTLNVEAYYFAQ